jgi:hypothetical protein
MEEVKSEGEWAWIVVAPHTIEYNSSLRSQAEDLREYVFKLEDETNPQSFQALAKASAKYE